MIEDKSVRFHEFSRRLVPDIDLATITTGSGDHMMIVFSSDGILIKGLSHESSLSPWSDEILACDITKVRPGLIDRIPAPLDKYLTTALLMPAETTFTMWFTTVLGSWNFARAIDTAVAHDDGGADDLLELVLVDAEQYFEWASEYIGEDIPRAGIDAAFSAASTIGDVIHALHRSRLKEKILAELMCDESDPL